MARTYRYDLNCDAKALDVYKQMMELEAPKDMKRSVASEIEELEAKRGEGPNATE